jgi:hypothetical protein
VLFQYSSRFFPTAQRLYFLVVESAADANHAGLELTAHPLRNTLAGVISTVLSDKAFAAARNERE